MQKSYFDGGILTYIFSCIISFYYHIYLWLGTPWAICIFINGKLNIPLLKAVVLDLMALHSNCLETGSNGFSYVLSH